MATAKAARTVAWYETRQDRASEAADRRLRAARCYEKEAVRLSTEGPLLPKSRVSTARIFARNEQIRAAHLARTTALWERANRLMGNPSALRLSGAKYGRAKALVATYDPVYGWRDRETAA